ncbi:trypsin-like serine protease [Rhodopseudomonas palustris]|uniref:S1 family peptidase n=1 Tax=Rhodopseudomonas palustris TaxID=1076 RepID=UPI0022F0CE1D|nr:trypsin-like serine protease [Rhodopseudomonas palustris]WBU31737.1 trypsin-like serine protease [Rhodopseudomonas palustris]
MIRTLTFGCLLGAALASPAAAMVGGAPEATGALGRALVTIVGSRGNFCSGTLIAPDLVLSAAHCVGPGADYKVVQYDAQRQPSLRDVARVAAHPQFDMGAILGHRASADVALLKLAAPLPGKAPLPIAAPDDPLAAGQDFTVAGIGVTRRGDGKSGGTARSATLTATGRPGRLQIRLSDPAATDGRAGLGACTGDSGGPALQAQNDRLVVVGVVSWSTGPGNTAGCGGLTGVTPLTLYRDWIARTAQSWGSALSR